MRIAEGGVTLQGKGGRYTLVEKIAQGGMAEVWKATDQRGATVCIKRMDASLRGDIDFIEMFRDEASLVLDLDHDNIVRTYELVDTDDELFLAMELVDGPSLQKVRTALADLGDGLSVPEALQIAIYLCRALHHAHTRTRDGDPDGEPLLIVHRDVSPQNVLLTSMGQVKLVDFGIAKAAQRLTRTKTGTLKGKCSYMAPEQARGERLDHRADQFAAGVILWEMLTGRRLFGGRNEVLILEQVVRSEPVPPSTVKKGIPRSVDRAVLRALGWKKEERFADMAAFESALQQCLQEVWGEATIDLAALVDKTERWAKTVGPVAEGAPGTRVIGGAGGGTKAGTNPAAGSTDSDEVIEDPSSSVVWTNPLAQPEHTGQFFRRRSRATALALAGAGAIVVGGGVTLAVVFAERDPAPKPVVVVDAGVARAPWFADLDAARAALSPPSPLADALTACQKGALASPPTTTERACRLLPAKLKADALSYVDAVRAERCLLACHDDGTHQAGFAPPSMSELEARLQQAQPHPCRTELLDDLLDPAVRTIGVLGKAGFADDVDECLRNIAEDAKLKASTRVEAPEWPKKKQRTPAVIAARVQELSRRGKRALRLGDYQRAKELLVEEIELSPERVSEHALLGQAFRGLGDPAGAAHHFRLFLHAFPDDADQERVSLYLVRYHQDPALGAPSSGMGVDERHARARRLADEAKGTGDPGLWQQASALLPDRADYVEARGLALMRQGKNEDARAAFVEAIQKGGDKKRLSARIRALGNPS